MATFGFEYRKTNTGITIEKYLGAESVVHVPEKIDGLYVREIDENAFRHCETLEEVYLPFMPDEIDLRTFFGCKQLKKIHWHATQFIFGENIFKIRSNNEIYLPSSLLNDNPQETANIPGKLVKTPVEDFNYRHVAEGITIEKYLGAAEVVVVPPKIDGVSVVRIGFDAFGGCRNLKELRLPADLLSLNWRALDGCDNLEYLYIPETILDNADTGRVLAALPKKCKVRYV